MTEELLHHLSEYCDEFLIHAVDVEGKASGIETELVELLAKMKDFPVTYAGGVGSFEDLELLKKLGNNHVDVTIGSALDLFGGKMKFEDVLAVCRGKRKRTFTRCHRKTALSALSAAAQLLFAHNQALPLYLILDRFSCEYEICQK